MNMKIGNHKKPKIKRFHVCSWYSW